MLKINDRMSVILEDDTMTENCLQLDVVLKEIVSKTKKIRNCIIYDDDGTLEEEKINFNRVIQFNGDWTGYEVSCNELRFEKNIFLRSQFLELASRLSKMLSQKFDDQEIVVYVSLYDEIVDLRFHIYREDEGLWLVDDLNEYEVPILCWIEEKTT